MYYFSWNISDYKAHTEHLNDDEDLAYRRMLDRYYLQEKPLPLDINKLARLIKMREKVEAIESILEEFFHKKDDGYHNNRADGEIVKYKSKSEKASASAKARWNKGGDASALQSNSVSNTKQEPLTIKQETKSKAKASPDDSLLATFMDNKILEINPKRKKPNMESWSDVIRVTREQDNRTHKELQDVFLWACKDEFWSKQILSPTNLRKHFDKLTLLITEPVKSVALLKVTPDDNNLWNFAKQNKLPDPQNRDNFQYRRYLQGFIAHYGILTDGTMKNRPEWLDIPKDNTKLRAWVVKHKYPQCPDEITSIAEYKETILAKHIRSKFIFSYKG